MTSGPTTIDSQMDVIEVHIDGLSFLVRVLECTSRPPSYSPSASREDYYGYSAVSWVFCDHGGRLDRGPSRNLSTSDYASIDEQCVQIMLERKAQSTNIQSDDP